MKTLFSLLSLVVLTYPLSAKAVTGFLADEPEVASRKLTVISAKGPLKARSYIPAAITVTNPTNTTPNLAATYASLAQAITAINAVTAMSGPVIFSIDAYSTETAPAGGYLLGNATLNALTSATNTITFQKGGEGANPLITAFTSGTSTTTDGIWKIQGTDYVTISNIDLQENGSNTTPTQQMEWGYAIVKLSLSDGTQNISINGCTVSLNKANTISVGIYGGNHIATATTALVVVSAAGTNANIHINGNTVSNCYTPISISGYTTLAYYDTGLEIGTTTGNIISTYGGGAVTPYGIYVNGQNAPKIENNSVNLGTGTTVAAYGINVASACIGNLLIHGNTVSVSSSATTVNLYGISNLAPIATTVDITDNIIQNCNFATATTGVFYGISEAAATTGSTVNITGNTVTGITYSGAALAGSGSVYAIYKTGGTPTAVNVNTNIIHGNALTGTTGGTFYGVSINSGNTQTASSNQIYSNTIGGTGTAGTIYGIFTVAGIVVNSDNTIYNNQVTKSTATSGGVYGLYNAAAATNETYSGNTIYGLSSAGSSLVYGIYNSTGAGMRTVSDNTVYSFSSAGGTVYGIFQALSSPTIYQNKIYDLTATLAAGKAYGLYINSGTTVTAYNNIIGDLKTPTGTQTAPTVSLAGIYVNGGTTINGYYNTVYLNATSSGTNFGTVGIYVSTTPTVTLRNNILVNNSTPAGTGKAAAYQRSSTTLTTYATASNTNLFYAGTPGVANLIMYDGTNSYQTIETYRTALGLTRDASSVTENPVWLSTTGSSTDYLHIDPTVATAIESGAAPIATYTDDFDGQTRHGNPDYSGSGTAPDIGADEFEGTAFPQIITVTNPTNTTPNLAATYSSLANAFRALHGITAMSGPVIFNIAAGSTETAPANGFVLGNATLNALTSVTNTITFQKSGAGANPLITAFTPGTSTTTDGIWKIQGTDYVTIGGIDLQENAANTTATQQMEWGYAIVKLSATDGAKNITITDCGVTLNKANTASVGIYGGNHIATATTPLTIASVAGTNANIKINGCTVSNCYNPVYISGYVTSATYYDSGLEIGSTSGNTLTNYGGGSVVTYGIYVDGQTAPKIENNTVTLGVGSTGDAYGIQVAAACIGNLLVNANTISVSSSGTTTALLGINNLAPIATNLDITDNIIQSCNFAIATNGIFYGISEFAATTGCTVNITGNTVTGITYSGASLAGSGQVYGIQKIGGTPTAVNVNANTISEITMSGTTGGSFRGIGISSGNIITADGNRINNNTLGGTGHFGFYGIDLPNHTEICSNNLISNNRITTGGGNMIGLYTSSAGSVSGNIIYGMSSAEWGRVTGILCTASTIFENSIYDLACMGDQLTGIEAFGNNLSIYRNKVYNLSSTLETGTVYGIKISALSSAIVYNNLICDLRTPNSSGSSTFCCIAGITVAGSAAIINVYYNSIYLNASSTGTDFKTAGIYSVTSSVLDLRNNIIVNTSTTNGAGKTVAFLRSDAILTTYAATSNNNLFYAETPGPNNLIMYDGTNSYQTLADFKTAVGPTRDAQSISEIPNWLSTTGSDATFLHINPAIASGIESGGTGISIVTDDFDGDIRQGSAGYAGGGSAPDIGADEFEGIPLVTPITVTNPTNTTPNLAPTYNSLSTAISALNAVTAMTGPVIINMAAGSRETAPAGGYLLGSATLNAVTSATNTIIFQKTGEGENPLLTAFTPGTGSTDGIWKIQGCDWVSIIGFDLQENVNNTTGIQQMEWGLAILKLSETDGSQNINISVCKVSLNRASTISVGIYGGNHLAGSTTGLTVSSIPGTNSNIRINGCIISSCSNPIRINGCLTATYYDTGLEIGTTTGNLISDFGGGNSREGICVNGQNAPKIENNSVTPGLLGSDFDMGIRVGVNCIGDLLIHANTITVQTTAYKTSVYCIMNESPVTSLINITDNLIQNCNFETATTGDFYGIYESSGQPGCTVNITGNTISGITYSAASLAGSGIVSAIYSAANPTFVNVNSNIIHGITLTGTTGGGLYGIWIFNASNVIARANLIYDNHIGGTGTIAMISGIYCHAGNSELSENFIYNNIITKSTAIGGIRGISGDAVSAEINQNSIFGLSSAGASIIYGIDFLAGNLDIYKNKIYSFSSDMAAGRVFGVNIPGGTTINIFNNLIGDLRTPAGTQTAPIPSLAGIYVGAGTTINACYNTINLNATSTATNFGTAAIYAATTPNVDLRNNLLVNNSTAKGTGKTIAYQRSTTTLTTYSATSGNNLFYAGTPGAANLIMYDGTNSYQTLGAYQTAVGPTRDASSISENPNWLSTTGADANFLHINPAIATGIESGAANIATYTDDFDAQTRQGNTGYAGTGTAPDIGADEFEGTSYPQNITVTGNTNTTPNLAPNYSSLANAIRALNGVTAMSGPVIFSMAAGSTETAPAGGYLLGNATLNALTSVTNTITFQKGGEGANPLITAFTPGTTTTTDGIWKIQGTDYVTISNIDLQENSSNTTPTQQMEWGYAIVKLSLSDGTQNISINGCTVSLNKANTISVGIYGGNHIATATTALVVVSAAGTNANIHITGNTVSNCYTPISISGYTTLAYYDTGLEIGTTTGNTLSNYGGGAVTPYGIYVNGQNAPKIENNSVTLGTGTTVAAYGINVAASCIGNLLIHGNKVSVSSSATTVNLYAINNLAPIATAVDITDNIIQSCNFATATTGVFYGISEAAATTGCTVNITGNTVTGITYSGASLAGSGSVYAIYKTGGTPTAVNVNTNIINGNALTGTTGGTFYGVSINSGNTQTASNNQIYSNTISGTGTAGTIYGIVTVAGIVVNSDNTIYNNQVTKSTATSGGVYGLYNAAAATNETYSGNIIYGLSSAGSSLVYGIYNSTGAGVRTVSGNTIYSLSSAGGTVYGIYQALSSPTIYQNKIYDLTATLAAGKVYGLYINSGTTVTAYNNIIGDLKTPAGTQIAPTVSLAGIYVNGGTTINGYYNTVYLNATSSGTNFGTTGIYVLTAPTVTLRNNILVNNSTAAGTGKAAAYQRSSTTLTTYATASNTNLFYAGTPGAANLIMFDGTNSYQTLATFKTAVGPTRDAASITENPNWVSSTGADATYLHINPTLATGMESGAVNIAGISDDFDAQTRQGNPGYIGSGSTPDIGADEFEGTPLIVPITVTNPTNTTPNLAATYNSLAAAIAAMNAVTAMSGPVIFTMADGSHETAPAGGYLLGNATLNSLTSETNTITFQKSGSGANPLITAFSPGTSTTTDGIWKIQGTDWVTISGFDLQENSANTDATQQMEWGIAVLKLSETDGSQNINITNCVVSLNKANMASVGIYGGNHVATATTTLTITSASGTNANVRINGCTVSNCYNPVYISGYVTSAIYYDSGLEIGSTSGNSLTNYGGMGGSTYGIYVNGETAPKIENNQITPTPSTNGFVCGIMVEASCIGDLLIHANTLSLSSNATTVNFYGIRNNAPIVTRIDITDNIIQNCNLETCRFGYLYGIFETNARPGCIVNITGNTISGVTFGSASSFGCEVGAIISMGNRPSEVNVNSNIINAILVAGPSGRISGISLSFGTIQNVNGNQIYNNTIGGTETFAEIYCIATLSGHCTINNNVIYNNRITKSTASNTSSIYGIYSNGDITNSANNQIYSLSSLGASQVCGIMNSGNGQNINNNRIYDLSSSLAAGTVFGISASGLNTTNIFNNLIGDLRTPAGTQTAPIPSLAGIYISAGPAVNAYYNTINLNATSSATNFGTTAIYAVTTTNMDLRNNLLVNNSTPKGTGKTIACQRSTTTLTSYTETSNNNLFYAGTPGASNLIMYDGTNSYQTLSAFRAAVGPVRDVNSITELPNWVSTTGADATYLHINPSIATGIESGGANIATYTDDFDGDIRQGNPGYSGTGTAPDIGADEFEGTPLARVITVTNPTNTTPYLASYYPSLAAAINAINAVTAMSGPVIFSMAAGSTETAPASGYLLGNATLNALTSTTNTITFQKGGDGTNPLITAFTPGTSTTTDGIWKIQGTDYVTITNIDLQENASNTTPTQQMEWGYAIVKLSLSDGTQNISINGCTVSLNKANTASVGIYGGNHIATATTGLVIVSAAGTNANIRINGCTVSNCYTPISISGYSTLAYYDTGLEIGITTGNTLSNYGGGAVTPYGIYVNGQNAPKIENNTVTLGTGTTVAAYGINVAVNCIGNLLIHGNTVSVSSSATTVNLYAINNLAPIATAVDITDNIIQSCNFATATTGVFYGISEAAATTGCTVNITGNTVTGITYSGVSLAGSGSVYAIYKTGGTPTAVNANSNIFNGNSLSGTTGGTFYGISINSGNTQKASNNEIYNNTIGGTGTAGTIYGIVTVAGIVVNSDNTIYNNQVTKSTATSGGVYGLYNAAAATNETYSGNIIYGLSSAGSSLVYGIYNSTGAGVRTVSGNTIYSLSSAGGTVYGIYQALSSPTIYQNKIYDLTATLAAGKVYGLYINSGTTITAYNNIIGDLKTPAGTQIAPTVSLAGIYVNGGTTINGSYNTVYLNATSSGTNFGTAGIYVSTTPTVTLRNNILVNNSTPAGTGKAAAYQRSSTTLTTYATASNTNLFYAGTPGSANLIHYNGTNSYQTLAAYQTAVGPSRDAASITENPNWLSNTGSSLNYLHINPAILTFIESGATNIAGITDDFDEQVRQANPGYAGTGTAPDIGADEFEGFSCINPTQPGTIAGDQSGCYPFNPALITSTQDPSGHTGTLEYKWQKSTISGTTGFEDIGSSNSNQFDPGALAVTTWFRRLARGSCLISWTGAVESAPVMMTVNPFPAIAGSITGAAGVNPGDMGVAYSVGTIANATSYIWEYSGTGVTINGTGTDVTLDFSAECTWGELSVKGRNDCGDGVSSTLSISGDKTINLSQVFLQGLYEGGGSMREARDEAGPEYGDGIADHITVELHDENDYWTIIYTVSDVALNTDGTATLTVPGEYNGSYYITIKHRNSLETPTSIPFSFAGSTITQSFGALSDVYGGNLAASGDGYYLIYAGDVNQDGFVDTQDYIGVDNDSYNYVSGYFATDVDGNGTVDTNDYIFIDNNNYNYISAIYPSGGEGFATVTTTAVTEIAGTSATSGGNVTSDGGAGVFARGVCWSTSPAPTTANSKTTDGTGTGLFTSSVTGLIVNATYYVRAYATNVVGTVYGAEVSFKTLETGSFTDSRDSKVYNWVKIGDQTWMSGNLAYLPAVSTSATGSETAIHYYVYGYEGTNVATAKAQANYTTYGALYNWPAALTACPSGWHLPNDAEWTILTDYLTNNGYGYGGSGSDIGKSMAATLGWTSYSTAGTVGSDQASNNSSGFTALPGGYRYSNGGFGGLGSSAFFWSSSGGGSGAWGRDLYYGSDGVGRNYDGRSNGFSVRCLRND